MLGKYISINNEQMPNPESFSGNLNPSENVFESEAGTQMSNVVRLDRPSWSASFNCSSRLKDKLIAFCKIKSVNAVVDGEAMRGRLRLGGYDIVKDSENTQGTDGLWTVSVEFQGE